MHFSEEEKKNTSLLPDDSFLTEFQIMKFYAVEFIQINGPWNSTLTNVSQKKYISE